IPVRLHVLAAAPTRLDHEFLGVTEAFVEVELDLVGADTAIRPLTGLIRGLEEGERAVAAPRSLGAHVQLSALFLDESDRLRRGLDAHVPNGTTVGLSYPLYGPKVAQPPAGSPRWHRGCARPAVGRGFNPPGAAAA